MIKNRFKDMLIDPHRWELPYTFGAASEVVHAATQIELDAFLHDDEATDATHHFLS